MVKLVFFLSFLMFSIQLHVRKEAVSFWSYSMVSGRNFTLGHVKSNQLKVPTVFFFFLTINFYVLDAESFDSTVFGPLAQFLKEKKDVCRIFWGG